MDCVRRGHGLNLSRAGRVRLSAVDAPRSSPEKASIALQLEPSPAAVRLYADAIRAKGPAWGNAADSILSGGYGNAWTQAALSAIEAALRIGPGDDE